jgi:uncharacterized surface protein with fasciclin (FAS1) repeats
MRKLRTIGTGAAVLVLLVMAPPVVAHCGGCSSDTGAHARQSEPAAKEEKVMIHKNIVETAMAVGEFNTLVSAVKSAGLVETLSGAGPFTVFAPTDSAFAKLPESAIDALLKDKAKLTSVLTYHVVPGTLTSSDVAGPTSAETVNGQAVKISTTGQEVLIDSANVVAADIMCSNGVIHVIDEVLLPN